MNFPYHFLDDVISKDDVTLSEISNAGIKPIPMYSSV